MGHLPLFTGRSLFWPDGGLTSQKENRSLDEGHMSEYFTIGNLPKFAEDRKKDVPERTFSSHTKILHDEPDTNFILGIVQPESASGTVSNQISRKHPLYT